MKKLVSVVMVILIFSSTVSASFRPFMNGDVNMMFDAEFTQISEEIKNIFEIKSTKIKGNYDIVFEKVKHQLAVQMAFNAITSFSSPGKKTEGTFKMDISDSQNPELKYVINSEEFNKHITMDYSEMLETMPELVPINIVAMNSYIEDALPEKEYREHNGVYSVTYSDEEIKYAAAQLFHAFRDIAVPHLYNDGSENFTVTEEMYSQYTMIIDEVARSLSDVNIISDDGVTVNVTVDDNNRISTIDFEAKIKTNLKKILNALRKAVSFDADIDLSKITESNSYIEGSVRISAVFSNHGPEWLSGEVDNDKVNVFCDGVPVRFDDAEPLIENGRTLVPIRRFCNAIGIPDENILYENGVITISYGSSMVILKVNDTVVTKIVSGVPGTVVLDVPATIRNDRTLVPLRFLSENFGCTVEYSPIEGYSGAVVSVWK